MPRNRDSGGGGEEAELNLVPFMNMVVILIPLLLLSVVFLKIGVINITAPNLGPVKQPKQTEEDKDKKKLDLTVTVGENGFYVAARDAREPPIDGCPDGGPTICLKEDKNVGDLIDGARSDFQNGNDDAGQQKIRDLENAYNWRGLYNKLMEIKGMIEKNQDIKDTNVINITADPGIPYDLLIRTMDVARFKLEDNSYDSDDEFWSASLRDSESEKTEHALLFSQPVLSVAKN